MNGRSIDVCLLMSNVEPTFLCSPKKLLAKDSGRNVYGEKALYEALQSDLNCVLAPKGYNVSTVHDEVSSSKDQWKRRKRLSYQNKLECWETCEVTCHTSL